MLKLSIGDVFEFRGDRRFGATGGVITKINTVTFLYKSVYLGSTLLLRSRIDDLFVPGLTRVQRDGIIYDIAYDANSIILIDRL